MPTPQALTNVQRLGVRGVAGGGGAEVGAGWHGGGVRAVGRGLAGARGRHQPLPPQTEAAPWLRVVAGRGDGLAEEGLGGVEVPARAGQMQGEDTIERVLW